MKVSLEYLYHFCCDRCKKWWTCTDIKTPIGKTVYCPRCQVANKVESVETHEIELE
jgi:endogenous inhibitor of DNA gyrase (YacG/DUF329 family)